MTQKYIIHTAQGKFTYFGHLQSFCDTECNFYEHNTDELNVSNPSICLDLVCIENT